ncbi:WecB/TagA/CpsF family glycosyltransferase [Oculatella sp. LEGE 06141]|nr:WecB/TagA/CpsF family glycosyltransferase [Oculatella sp. LEGE 06141]
MPSSSPSRATVLGLPLHLLEDYPAWLIDQIQQQKGVHVVTLNAEMAMQAEQNSALATIVQQADLVIPDGSGVVLYLSLRGKRVQRCPGIELAELLLQRSPHCQQPCSVFLYGGQPGVCQQAAEVLQQRIPGLAIAGSQHGYLSTDEQHQLRQTLADCQPRIILVGLGVPRQELWIAEHRHLCPHAVWIGVGGSFDIWAGTKVRAPEWLRNNHLEWVYRLYQEPWRWRRMLALPRFAWRALVHSGQ